MRARNIKPGFFTDEKLIKCSPLARLLFAGLWCFADKEGRFLWKPSQIRVEIFPDQPDVDVVTLLGELSLHSVVTKYAVEEQTYGWLPHFKDHQRPHPHEADSKLPAFSLEFQCHDISPLHVAAKCHDMSNHFTAECPSDSLIPDSLIPEDKDKESADTPPLDFGLPPEKRNGHYTKRMCKDDLKVVEVECRQIEEKSGTGKKKVNPYGIVQGLINKGIHPRAILRALQELNTRWDTIDIPFKYIQTIIPKLNFRAQEEAAIQESKSVAKLWDNLAAKMPKGIIPDFDMRDPPPNEQERIRQLREQAATLKGM